MLQGWVVIAVALGYIGLLFLVASYGDRARRFGRHSRARLWIYPLSLAIYCTSWTFFGSVGSASRSGLRVSDHLYRPGAHDRAVRAADRPRGAARQGAEHHLDRRLHRSALRQEPGGAAIVALIAIVGTVPYIALQLKAVSFSLETIIAHIMPNAAARPLLGDMALFVALSMAVFAVLFGTRHIDATEHQDGLILAVATESIVKLVSFSRGRHLRDVLHVRWSDGAVRQGDAVPAGGFGAHPRASRRRADRLHAPVLHRDAAAGRGNSTSRWSRTTTSARSSARAGCFRSTWC